MSWDNAFALMRKVQANAKISPSMRANRQIFNVRCKQLIAWLNEAMLEAGTV